MSYICVSDHVSNFENPDPMDNTSHCVLQKKYKRTTDDKYNVKLCVYFNGVRHHIQTKFDLTEDEWEKLKSSTLKEKRLLDIRKSIKEIEQTMTRLLEKNYYQHFETLLEEYDNTVRTVKKNKDVYYWFDQYKESLIKEGRPHSYVAHVETSKNSFKSFKSDLQFFNITSDFLVKYRSWLNNPVKRDDTCKSYLRDLRTVFNYAISKHAVSKEFYPFGRGGYKVGANTKRKYALTKLQIQQMVSLDLSDDKEMEEARDIFIFQYLTNGINLVDLCLLKESNIQPSEFGPCLLFQRTKTKETKGNPVMIVADLGQKSLTIIEKWGNQNRNQDDYIFPYFNSIKNRVTIPKTLRNKVLAVMKTKNKQLRKIGEKLEIKMKITTGIARHTFGNVVKSNGENSETIKDLMGHSSSQVTESFYTEPISIQRVKEISQNLL